MAGAVISFVPFQILKCYHTYCKSCLEQFMFQDNIITCLSCGATTPAKR